jgi:hypothetical protein
MPALILIPGLLCDDGLWSSQIKDRRVMRILSSPISQGSPQSVSEPTLAKAARGKWFIVLSRPNRCTMFGQFLASEENSPTNHRGNPCSNPDPKGVKNMKGTIKSTLLLVVPLLIFGTPPARISTIFWVKRPASTISARARFDATQNYWGCPAGPRNSACSDVKGPKVLFTPWLTKSF